MAPRGVVATTGRPVPLGYRMTRTHRPFPVAFRLLATACAVAVLAAVGPMASADDAPTKADVDAARDRKHELKHELDAQVASLAALETELNQAAFEVDRLEGDIEQTRVELAGVQKRIAQTQRRYDGLRRRLNDRAAQAFMDGPGTSLELILDAATFSEFTDRIEFVEAVNAADATLAQDVANLGYELGLDQDRLAELKAEQQDNLAQAEDRERLFEEKLAQAQALRAQIDANLEEAQRYSKKTNRLYQEAQDAYQTGSHSNVPLPAQWRGVLEVCPVDQPRAFGDGFGAPRYVGGFHPHRGVDIVAPEGTPVRATFDGFATDATNTLGGTAVKVSGTYGTTYNAHLGSIVKLGSVQAGDVIGTVSSTGLAGGTTPHDHFEFWPNVVPSDWIVSYYGYAVIDGAINPYPLLVDACG
jgi:murein DD-endopeptidase MepM/ murein hydrolase activator NlpD